jgi:hypothetical protein
MANGGKQLSNSFSTGSGGARFETHIQASFVTLMLSRGFAPCLPCWPIIELKLQGKVAGYETDDLIVVVKNPSGLERRHMLGQVKHSITFTDKVTNGKSTTKTTFAEVIQAAWCDFNNPAVFQQGKDIIALITGPLSATDLKGVSYILEQARHTGSVDEFLIHIEQGNFSSNTARNKLVAFRTQLKSANDDVDVSDQQLYAFLKDFHLLGYDLDKQNGVISSLMHSHIGQFNRDIPREIWSRILEEVQGFNQQAGTITLSNLSEDITDYFKPKEVNQMPASLIAPPVSTKTNLDWSLHEHANSILLACLIGSWNEKKSGDIDAIKEFIGSDYSNWVITLQKILQLNDSPLSFVDGVWSITNRDGLWLKLSGLIFDDHLDKFQLLATSVLSEKNPAFQLDKELRFEAPLKNMDLKHSSILRKNLAQGLSYIGNPTAEFKHCSQGKANYVVALTVRNILANADWILWGSINDQLPALAEASPKELLSAIESAIDLSPCPFDELFAQEGSGMWGGNYLTGLLWALEILAWDERYIVRVCVLLAELAAKDPGGQWTNRPINSLTEIVLPWLPQTLASTEKRQLAIRTVCNEQPNIGWLWLLSLLPNQHTSSSGTYKPKWRATIPEAQEQGVTNTEYWEQSRFYANLAVELATGNIDRLCKLVDLFDHIPLPASTSLLTVLRDTVEGVIDDDLAFSLWSTIVGFLAKHRRFPDVQWTLSEDRLSPLDNIAKKLDPLDPLKRHNRLFSVYERELYSGSDNLDEQGLVIAKQRKVAVEEILAEGNVELVLEFVSNVKHPNQVGYVLAELAKEEIDTILLPNLISKKPHQTWSFISAYISKRRDREGWKWFDKLDKTNWQLQQIAMVLCALPFCHEAWERADSILGADRSEYWLNTYAEDYQAEGDLTPAIMALLEFKRSLAAIRCFNQMIRSKQEIDIDLAGKSLLSAVSSNEPDSQMDSHYSIELIKVLQNNSDTKPDLLFDVEWAYVPILNRYNNATPIFLEQKIASDSDFFCQLIQLVYRPKGSERAGSIPEGRKKAATNAYKLLKNWKIVPGLQKDGSFNCQTFSCWLSEVEKTTQESNHFDVAMQQIGQVLINAPKDCDGLWIDHCVAQALNERKYSQLRRGLYIGFLNSRGVYGVDVSGESERKLATKYGELAEQSENKGYQRLAQTLNEISDNYKQEAEQVMTDSRWS